MALPAGVTTATVTVGVPVTHTGAEVKTFVSIEPSAFLVHAATGTPLVDFLEELAINEGVAGQFTLPHTDQAGFTDEAGNAYTNWYYTARVTYTTPSKAKAKAPKVKVFQITTGQTTVDLDKLPGGAPALPYIAPTAKVDAFQGRTGAVTLLESDLPGRLAAPALDASILDKVGKSPTANRQRISAQGAITISIDDGYERVHRVLYPILRDEYPNQRWTFGITSSFIGSNNSLYLTEAQVQELHAAGHEIANHSYLHRNAATATPTERLQEFDESNAALEAMIGEPVTTWIYPQGNNARNAQTDQELYGRFARVVNAGVSWGGSMVPMSQRNGLFMVPRPAVWDSTTHQTVLELIRQTATQPVILNLYAHRPGDGPTGGTSGGGAADMTVTELREALDLIEELGIPVVTIKDAFPGQPVLGNPGAEDGTRGWIPVISGAGKSFSSVTDTPAAGLNGTKSFKLASTDAVGLVYAYQDMPCIEGQSYVFSARTRKEATTTAGTATIRIQARDQFGAAVGGQTSASNAFADGVWGKVSTAPVVAPVGAQTYRVDMILNNHVGEMYVDHLYYGRTGLGDFG